MKNKRLKKFTLSILIVLAVFVTVVFARPTQDRDNHWWVGEHTYEGLTNIHFEGAITDGTNITTITVTEPTAARTITIPDGDVTLGNTNAHTADVTITGTTPTLTIGDGGAEDAGFIFNGVADYYFAADDTGGLAEDVVCIGVGAAIGTTPTVCYDASQQMILENGEIFENTVDGEVAITSAANDPMTFAIRGAATGTESAILELSADDAGDAADTWLFTAADGGALSIANDGTATMTIGEAVTVSGALTASAAATVGTTLGVTGITTLAGVNQPVITVTDAATYTVLAANTGKVHLIGDLSQATDIDLPSGGGTAGQYYKFIYIGGADDAADHTIDALSDTNYFIGGVAFADTDAGDAADEINAGIYSDGGSNSKLTINNISAGTVVEVFSDGTNWYVSGRVFADTAPAFADQ